MAVQTDVGPAQNDRKPSFIRHGEITMVTTYHINGVVNFVLCRDKQLSI